MKKDSKTTANNIYSVLDNEMARLHDLIHMYTNHPMRSPNVSTYDPHASQMVTCMKQLLSMQSALIDAFRAHEPAIQEKVAELALTGRDDE